MFSRGFILFITALLMTGCADPGSNLRCDSVDHTEMTREAQSAASSYCSEVTRENAVEDSLTARVQREAEIVGLPVEEFVKTRLGIAVLVSEMAKVIIAISLVFGGWLLVVMIIRFSTWEVESAVRKKWGPFSIWHINYSRQKEEFLE